MSDGVLIVLGDSPLRYAVLHHTGIDEPHFDLLFELQKGALLACWRSACWPITQATTLQRLADHRREYLDYEGPISGNRGEVRRVAGGEFWLEAACEEALQIRSQEGWRISMRRSDHSDVWTAEGERL